MNEQQMLLADSAGKCFESLGAKTAFAEGWRQVEALGLNLLLIAEADGGFGGSWDDALIVLRLVGANALPLPVAEAILAASLAPAGTQGFGSIATKTSGSLRGGVFTGGLIGVPWGRHADYVVAAIDGAVVLLGKPEAVAEAKNLADEPRDRLTYEHAPVTALAAAPLLELAALARTGQMAGAIGAALQRSVTYVNERQQFGRPLAKFQAVQQTLASFAAEAAAADCAAQSAAQAMQRGHASFEIACAKLRANMAAGIATATAHQMHGAIGFTLEYDLHPLTRRLWSWRSEYGNDHFWALRLGDRISARGAANFWSDLTASEVV
jgi:acyl-CoA dehydrogenase